MPRKICALVYAQEVMVFIDGIALPFLWVAPQAVPYLCSGEQV